MEDLRYPIGPFDIKQRVTSSLVEKALDDIESAPLRLREAVAEFDEHKLNTPYRPGGWTVRQVVHHIPDSHLNSYMRFRLALTEENPTIKPYAEDRWAELTDARTADPEISLALLGSLHRRWILLLRSLTSADLQRSFVHPDLGPVTLDRNICLYGWHGRHHVAQIQALRKRMGW